MNRNTTLVERIASFNRGRDKERLALKYKAMHKSAVAFFRGTNHLFCERWPRTHGVSDAPLAWVCGDLHIENFGAYKGDNRLTYFDIADFDESLLAPVTWDLTRFTTSALIAAKTYGLKHRQATLLCDAFLDAYVLAICDGKARWIERATARGTIGSLLQKLELRTETSFFEKRTQLRSGKLRLRIDGKHTLALAEDDCDRVAILMREFAKSTPNPRFFEVLDIARRIAGTASLGLDRYTILVEGGGAPNGHFLLDLKYARPTVLAKYVKQAQPRWKNQAERIVALERRLQAVSPALLYAVAGGAHSYVLRELMPSGDKLDLKGWKNGQEQFAFLGTDLGFLVAWSELRSTGRSGSATTDELIDFASGSRWRRSVVKLAEDFADITWRDWKTFREAFKDNAFLEE